MLSEYVWDAGVLEGNPFTSKMVDFYITRDATNMTAFVVDCHLGDNQVREVDDRIRGAIGRSGVDRYGLDEWVTPPSGAPADSEKANSNSLQQAQPGSLEEVRRQAREEPQSEHAAGLEDDSQE